jgi:hypothetical protein
MSKKKEDASNNSEEDQIFYVEKILDKRIIKGKTEYYLKWQGYSDKHK